MTTLSFADETSSTTTWQSTFKDYQSPKKVYYYAKRSAASYPDSGVSILISDSETKMFIKTLVRVPAFMQCAARSNYGKVEL